MVHSMFWVLVLSKYLLWMLLPENYFLAMLVWMVSLSGIVFLQICRSPRLLLLHGWTFYLYILYFLWVILCCFYSPPGQVLAAFCYALLPLFVWPFIPRAESLVKVMREFCWGVSLGSIGVLAYIYINYSFDQLSERAESIAQVGPNTIGFISVVGMFGAWYLFRTTQVSMKKIIFLGMVLCCAVAMFMSFSKTVLLGAFGALVISRFSLASPRSLLLGGVAAVVVCLVGVGVLWGMQEKILIYLDGAHSVSTLSGRTLLWEQIFRNFSAIELLFGRGFNSSVVISSTAGYVVFGTEAFGQAHNAFIEAVINSGLIGASILFFVVLTVAGRLLCRLVREHFGAWEAEGRILFFMLFILLIRSITEGSFSQPGTVDSVLLFYLTAASLAVLGGRRFFQIERRL